MQLARKRKGTAKQTDNWLRANILHINVPHGNSINPNNTTYKQTQSN